MKSCSACVHQIRYKMVNGAQIINICAGDGWEDNMDGSYGLFECTNFEADQCAMFKNKEEPPTT